MKIKDFNKSLRKLFRDVSLNLKNLELHGTYKYSYWASDIDLFEPCDYNDIEKLLKTIVEVSKIYKVKEVKVVENNKKRKFYNNFNEIQTTKPELIKVDLVLFDLVYPIDVSIIYDFDGEPYFNDLISDLLDEVLSRENHMYKKLKRLNDISNIVGYGNLFDNIINNVELGVMYLSKTRLKLLKEIRGTISYSDMKKYMNSISEDLRKFGYKTTDNLDKIMDEKINKLLKI